MNPKVIKRLEDAIEACERVQGFLKAVPIDTFLGSDLLRSAVERQLEIIGEALNAASKEDESLVKIIPDLPRIVALRNRLIHGYRKGTPPGARHSFLALNHDFHLQRWQYEFTPPPS